MFQLWMHRHHGALQDHPQAPRLQVHELWLQVLGVAKERRLRLLKVKSVSDLAFKALDILTEGEDELWVAHIVFDGQARRTGGIQKIMKNDCGVSYDAVQRILKRLVSKNIVYRVIQGIYAPNLKMLLPKMIELLEAEQEVENAAGG